MDRQTRRARRRRVLLWCGLGVLALCLLAAYRAVGIADDLSHARDDLRSAAAAVEDGRLAEAQALLADAQDRLVEANAALSSSPDLQLVGLVPVARQNLAALRSSVRVALELAAGGEQVLAGTEVLQSPEGDLEIPFRQGAIPIDAVLEAQSELEALRSSLHAIGPPSSSPLILPPIADVQEQIDEEIRRRTPHIENLANALALVSEMLGGNGDRRYLIAVANTAEMRGTGGMYLSYGVLESTDGDIDLAAFGNIDEVFLATAVPPERLEVPADELARWDGLEPTRLWRNVNLVPDFSVVAPRAAVMFETATGRAVDGVIQIDPHGLAALLAGIGPVEVPTVGTVTEDNVVALTLNEAYIQFPDRDQRQEVLGDVAEAVFERLVEGEYDSLRPLAEAVVDSVGERHTMLWSSRPAARAPITFFAADGPLPAGSAADHLILTTQNRGRDKLDFYLDSRVSLTGQRPAGQPGTVDVEVTFTNGAPPGVTEPAYIFGGDVEGEVPLGTYTGIASLYVPNGTTLEPTPEAAAAEAVLQPEGGRTVIGWPVTVAAGESVTVRLRLQLPSRPPGPYVIGLVPVPRVRPTTYDLALVDGDGGSLERTGPLREPELLAFG